MTQAEKSRVGVGIGSWLSSQKPVTVLKWRAPLFDLYWSCGDLAIQNLELLGGKGKGRIQHRNTIHFFSGIKSPAMNANHTFHPRPSHPYSE